VAESEVGNGGAAVAVRRRMQPSEETQARVDGTHVAGPKGDEGGAQDKDLKPLQLLRRRMPRLRANRGGEKLQTKLDGGIAIEVQAGGKRKRKRLGACRWVR